MRNFLYLLTLSVLVFTSCENEKPLQSIGESFTEKELEFCDTNPCPEITVDYLTYTGNAAAASKINTEIKKRIIRHFYLDDETIDFPDSIKDAATFFAEVYLRDREQYPDMSGTYEAIISVKEIYNSDDLISLEEQSYFYTGGAHGYGTTHFFNVNPKNGKVYTWDDLFKDNDAFVAFAEKKFREEKNISDDESINEPGFWFDQDTFYLPKTVGFTRDSILFIYNQYDIASYAEGPIELKINREEAKPYLNVQ